MSSINPKTVFMATIAALGLATATTVALSAAPVSQPDNLSSTIIYGGTPLTATSAVQIAPWGGGQVGDDAQDGFTTSGHGIQVSTAGLYQGTQIIFSPAVKLGDLKADKTQFLQFIMSVNPSTRFTPGSSQSASALQSDSSAPAAHLSFGNYTGQAKFQLAQSRGNPRRNFPPGLFPPGGQMRRPGMPTRPVAPSDETVSVPTLPIQFIHVILQFSNGAKAEMLRPVRAANEDIQWLRVSLPLAAIPLAAADSTNAQLEKIYFGTDSPAMIDIGEIRTVSNVTPLSAFAGDEMTMPTNSAVTFVGVGDGGASAIKFEWDFTSPDTFVPEAEGERVTHTFHTAGDYKVTLRVSDIDGIKDPATSTLMVHVTAQ